MNDKLESLKIYLNVIACRVQDGRSDREKAVEEIGVAVKLITFLQEDIRNGNYSVGNTDRDNDRLCRSADDFGACGEARREEET